MALGNRKGTVIGIDNQWDHEANIHYIQKRCPNFVFHLGDSVNSAYTIHEQFGEIDLLFIDTDHTVDRTLDEFFTYQPLLSMNAIVCFDDLLRHHPDHKFGMLDAWNRIPGEKLRLDFLHDGTYPHGGGFGVMWGF